ncbi:MAG: tetratricopeptide repeat protein, partial [Myxococcota bacterium]
FCSRCGAKLLPDARFCAECGQAAMATARSAARGWRVDRFAPLVVLAVVLVAGAVTVILGKQAEAPPNAPPPRAAAGGAPGPAAGMPEGHPPVEVPDGHPPVEVPEDVRKVIARMDELAKEKPDDMEAWRQLGFVQYRAGQVDPSYLTAALATYTHIIEVEPENLDALRALGNIAYDQNDPQRATDYYQRYLKVKPDDLSIQTDLGTMQLSTQQVEAALKTYQAVLAVDPKFFQAQFNLAIAYRAAGDSDMALAALQRAREVAADDATRQRVDLLLARLKGEPPPAPAAAPAGGGSAGGTLRGDVEAVFRGHPIVGPKLDRIDWPDDTHVRIILRQFPMDGMPPVARDKFTERIRT